ncbi:MAG: peptide-methionine (S)-S-oxide reductase MsrA [Bryobacteraceae bacterium]|nr:peptide-methionine (S)-S-oxide reductase MsrA [Bryobacteraceae bacterium]
MANTELATLGGGCFWCVEAVFDQARGVESVESGYMGGHVEQPTYRQISTGNTGHAEVIQIRYDPAVITFRELLEIFFAVHDPTTLNSQGNDVGTQYRSAIFYHTAEQVATARAVMLELAPTFSSPIVTAITAATRFFIAEDYHQEYFAKNGEAPYCQLVVAPKVAKFHKYFSAKQK